MVTKRVSKKTLKAEDEQLRGYELVYIISPEVAEEKADTIVDNVSQFITGRGGAISNVERWGKRKLSYPIKRFVEGDYVLVKFQFKPSLGTELETNLQISEEILRHLLVRLDGAE
ncbi:MAG: 30S ribosomal protein S6 [Dehalococcoidales bacterium]|jgi:small subunit ribosomal protein S6|nr:30S ribosomal protein S6 [Dehalococcoidales bacterium]|tara:strand:- start:1475 stop:1819 length:345 start_codon:yes stop_codon:yes gene_type:complete